MVVERSEREPGLLLLEAALPPALMIALDARLDAKAKEFGQADRAARKKFTAAGLTDDADPDGSGVGARPVLRTKDQRRADALAWYVLGPDPADPSRPKEPDVHVQVTIDLPTLLHLREHPGTLGRFGPIPAQVARELAADAQWQLFVHEPVTGYLLNQGDQTYRPETQLDRFVKARDVTDRFPGATTPATSCENDHQIPFGPKAGGETSAHNLASPGQTPPPRENLRRLDPETPRPRRHRMDHPHRTHSHHPPPRLPRRPRRRRYRLRLPQRSTHRRLGDPVHPGVEVDQTGGGGLDQGIQLGRTRHGTHPNLHLLGRGCPIAIGEQPGGRVGTLQAVEGPP